MTGQEMCERVAAEMKRRTGKDFDAQAFWNASPTGELGHVFDLYYMLFPEENPLVGAVGVIEMGIAIRAAPELPSGETNG
jgi:hypothetical protein